MTKIKNDRVRVWGAKLHRPTQGYIEYPPPGSQATEREDRVKGSEKRNYSSLFLWSDLNFIYDLVIFSARACKKITFIDFSAK